MSSGAAPQGHRSCLDRLGASPGRLRGLSGKLRSRGSSVRERVRGGHRGSLVTVCDRVEAVPLGSSARRNRPTSCRLRATRRAKSKSTIYKCHHNVLALSPGPQQSPVPRARWPIQRGSAHSSTAWLGSSRPVSRWTATETIADVQRLGKCRPDITADKDDLGATLRRRCADLVGSSVELTIRWQTDPHRSRTSGQEPKAARQHDRSEMLPTGDRVAATVVWSDGYAMDESTVAEKSSWSP
jgi:hypothetical protein